MRAASVFPASMNAGSFALAAARLLAAVALAVASVSAFGQSAVYPSKPLRLIVPFAPGGTPASSEQGSRLRDANVRESGSAAGICAATTDSSQRYPTKPLRLIVPFAPGGGNDLVARITALKLTEGLAQQVVVDNRPGGSGIAGTEIVAKATPDGYTLLLGFTAPLAISVSLMRLPYDPVVDFVPLDLLASSYHILAVHSAVPARSVKELIALAKSQPGKLNYASAGSGTNLHLIAEMFKMVAGVDIVHIPYKGTGPAAAAVLAGEAQLLFGSITSTLPYVRANRMAALAVTSPARSPLAPEVPTLDESGISGVEVPSWYTFLVPARTPREIAQTLRAEFKRIASSADYREQLARQGLEVKTLAPGEYTRFLKAEIAKWGKVVKSAGIRID